MRFRHPSLFNSYLGVTFVESTGDPSSLSRLATLNWLWRLKSVRWKGEIAYTGGGGTFDDLIMTLDRPLAFPGQASLDERDLLHATSLGGVVEGALSDASPITIQLEMFVTCTAFRVVEGSPAWQTPRCDPQATTTLGYALGVAENPAGILYGDFGPDATWALRQNYDGDAEFAGFLECYPHKYWGYDGLWDEDTGEAVDP